MQHITELRTKVSLNRSFEDIISRDSNIKAFAPFYDVPNLVLDVTIPVRHSLDPKPDATGRVGLRINRKKQNLVGFFNPIPSCLPYENNNPYLCIVYKTFSSEGTEIIESYHKENSRVMILV